MESRSSVKHRKACLFCGNSLRPKGIVQNAKSVEHVFPDWLQRHLGITGEIVTPMRVRTSDKQTIDLRQHVMGAFKAGPVCHGCNHGWMAALEEEAKPILVRVIDDPKQLEGLTEREKFVVARWTLKTAAVLNRSSTYGNPNDRTGRPVPDEHLRLLEAGGLPDDVLIAGAGYRSTKAVDFLRYALWTSPSNSIPLDPAHRDTSYKIALSLRDLVLMVAFYPSADYAYGINTHHYVLLRAEARRVVPINHLMDDAPAKSGTPHLEGLLRNISAVSLTWLKLVENVAFTRLVVA
jgi:hypothetical protein